MNTRKTRRFAAIFVSLTLGLAMVFAGLGAALIQSGFQRRPQQPGVDASLLHPVDWSGARGGASNWFPGTGNIHIGASGVPGTPAEQLAQIAWLVNDQAWTFAGRNIFLERDVNLQGREWIPIGHNAHRPFSGMFHGQNRTIANMSLGYRNNVANSGLFGVVQDGLVSNLYFSGGFVRGTVGGATERTFGIAVGRAVGISRNLTNLAGLRNVATEANTLAFDLMGVITNSSALEPINMDIRGPATASNLTWNPNVHIGGMVGLVEANQDYLLRGLVNLGSVNFNGVNIRPAATGERAINVGGVVGAIRRTTSGYGYVGIGGAEEQPQSFGFAGEMTVATGFGVSPNVGGVIGSSSGGVVLSVDGVTNWGGIGVVSSNFQLGGIIGSYVANTEDTEMTRVYNFGDLHTREHHDPPTGENSIGGIVGRVLGLAQSGGGPSAPTTFEISNAINGNAGFRMQGTTQVPIDLNTLIVESINPTNVGGILGLVAGVGELLITDVENNATVGVMANEGIIIPNAEELSVQFAVGGILGRTYFPNGMNNIRFEGIVNNHADVTLERNVNDPTAVIPNAPTGPGQGGGDQGSGGQPALNAPGNLRVSATGLVEWDAVANVTAYLIWVDGVRQDPTSGPQGVSFQIPQAILDNTSTIQIRVAARVQGQETPAATTTWTRPEGQTPPGQDIPTVPPGTPIQAPTNLRVQLGFDYVLNRDVNHLWWNHSGTAQGDRFEVQSMINDSSLQTISNNASMPFTVPAHLQTQANQGNNVTLRIVAVRTGVASQQSNWVQLQPIVVTPPQQQPLAAPVSPSIDSATGLITWSAGNNWPVSGVSFVITATRGGNSLTFESSNRTMFDANHALDQRNAASGLYTFQIVARHGGTMLDSHPVNVSGTFEFRPAAAPGRVPAWFSQLHQLIIGNNSTMYSDWQIARTPGNAASAPTGWASGFWVPSPLSSFTQNNTRTAYWQNFNGQIFSGLGEWGAQNRSNPPWWWGYLNVRHNISGLPASFATVYDMAHAGALINSQNALRVTIPWWFTAIQLAGAGQLPSIGATTAFSPAGRPRPSITFPGSQLINVPSGASAELNNATHLAPSFTSSEQHEADSSIWGTAGVVPTSGQTLPSGYQFAEFQGFVGGIWGAIEGGRLGTQPSGPLWAIGFHQNAHMQNTGDISGRNMGTAQAEITVGGVFGMTNYRGGRTYRGMINTGAVMSFGRFAPEGHSRVGGIGGLAYGVEDSNISVIGSEDAEVMNFGLVNGGSHGQNIAGGLIGTIHAVNVTIDSVRNFPNVATNLPNSIDMAGPIWRAHFAEVTMGGLVGQILPAASMNTVSIRNSASYGNIRVTFLQPFNPEVKLGGLIGEVGNAGNVYVLNSYFDATFDVNREGQASILDVGRRRDTAQIQDNWGAMIGYSATSNVTLNTNWVGLGATWQVNTSAETHSNPTEYNMRSIAGTRMGTRNSQMVVGEDVLVGNMTGVDAPNNINNFLLVLEVSRYRIAMTLHATCSYDEEFGWSHGTMWAPVFADFQWIRIYNATGVSMENGYSGRGNYAVAGPGDTPSYVRRFYAYRRGDTPFMHPPNRTQTVTGACGGTYTETHPQIYPPGDFWISNDCPTYGPGEHRPESHLNVLLEAARAGLGIGVFLEWVEVDELYSKHYGMPSNTNRQPPVGGDIEGGIVLPPNVGDRPDGIPPHPPGFGQPGWWSDYYDFDLENPPSWWRPEWGWPDLNDPGWIWDEDSRTWTMPDGGIWNPSNRPDFTPDNGVPPLWWGILFYVEFNPSEADARVNWSGAVSGQPIRVAVRDRDFSRTLPNTQSVALGLSTNWTSTFGNLTSQQTFQDVSSLLGNPDGRTEVVTTLTATWNDGPPTFIPFRMSLVADANNTAGREVPVALLQANPNVTVESHQQNASVIFTVNQLPFELPTPTCVNNTPFQGWFHGGSLIQSFAQILSMNLPQGLVLVGTWGQPTIASAQVTFHADNPYDGGRIAGTNLRTLPRDLIGTAEITAFSTTEFPTISATDAGGQGRSFIGWFDQPTGGTQITNFLTWTQVNPARTAFALFARFSDPWDMPGNVVVENYFRIYFDSMQGTFPSGGTERFIHFNVNEVPADLLTRFIPTGTFDAWFADHTRNIEVTNVGHLMSDIIPTFVANNQRSMRLFAGFGDTITQSNAINVTLQGRNAWRIGPTMVNSLTMRVYMDDQNNRPEFPTAFLIANLNTQAQFWSLSPDAPTMIDGQMALIRNFEDLMAVFAALEGAHAIPRYVELFPVDPDWFWVDPGDPGDPGDTQDPATFFLTLMANGGEGLPGNDPVHSFQMTPANTISSLNLTMTDSGRTFLGWFTSTNWRFEVLSTTNLWSIFPGGSATLIARWSGDTVDPAPDSDPEAFHLTIFGNGGTVLGAQRHYMVITDSFPTLASLNLVHPSHFAPAGLFTDVNFTHQIDSLVSLREHFAGNSGILVVGWSDVPRDFTLTLEGNGGQINSSNFIWVTIVDEFPPTGLAFSHPGRRGFNGWWTAAIGGTEITTHAQMRAHFAGLNQFDGGTLYAQWSDAPLFDLTLVINNAWGSMTISGDDVGPLFQITNYFPSVVMGHELDAPFLGWWTASTGGNLFPVPGATNPIDRLWTMFPGGSGTLYAQWGPNELEPWFTLTLNAGPGFNGGPIGQFNVGEGVSSDRTTLERVARRDASLSLMSVALVPTRADGAEFLGWFRNETRVETLAQLIATLGVATHEYTLTARWEEPYLLHLHAGEGIGHVTGPSYAGRFTIIVPIFLSLQANPVTRFDLSQFSAIRTDGANYEFDGWALIFQGNEVPVNSFADMRTILAAHAETTGTQVQPFAHLFATWVDVTPEPPATFAVRLLPVETRLEGFGGATVSYPGGTPIDGMPGAIVIPVLANGHVMTSWDPMNGPNGTYTQSATQFNFLPTPIRTDFAITGATFVGWYIFNTRVYTFEDIMDIVRDPQYGWTYTSGEIPFPATTNNSLMARWSFTNLPDTSNIFTINFHATDGIVDGYGESFAQRRFDRTNIPTGFANLPGATYTGSADFREFDVWLLDGVRPVVPNTLTRLFQMTESADTAQLIARFHAPAGHDPFFRLTFNTRGLGTVHGPTQGPRVTILIHEDIWSVGSWQFPSVTWGGGAGTHIWQGWFWENREPFANQVQSLADVARMMDAFSPGARAAEIFAFWSMDIQPDWPVVPFGLTLHATDGQIGGAQSQFFPNVLENFPTGFVLTPPSAERTFVAWYTDQTWATRFIPNLGSGYEADNLRAALGLGNPANTGTLFARWLDGELCPECGEDPCVCVVIPDGFIVITFDAGVGGLVNGNRTWSSNPIPITDTFFNFPPATRGTGENQITATRWYFDQAFTRQATNFQAIVAEAAGAETITIFAWFPGGEESGDNTWVWVALGCALVLGGGAAFFVLFKRRRSGYGG